MGRGERRLRGRAAGATDQQPAPSNEADDADDTQPPQAVTSSAPTGSAPEAPTAAQQSEPQKAAAGTTGGGAASPPPPAADVEWEPRAFPLLGSLARAGAVNGIVCRIDRMGKKESPKDVITLLHADRVSTSKVARSELSEVERKSAGAQLTAMAKLLATDGHWSFCTVCREGGQLMLCASCLNCAHLKCTAPPLDNVPSEHWFCDVCRGVPTALECAKQWRAACEAAVGDMAQHDTLSFFKVPVARTFINDRYADTVLHPIDLHTMSIKASHGVYTHPSQIGDDVELMVRNCTTFNKTDTRLVEYAGSFGSMAHRAVKQLVKRVKARDETQLRLPSDYVLSTSITGKTAVPSPVVWPSASHMTFEGKVRVSAISVWPLATLRYTTDGRDPVPSSPVWPKSGLVISMTTVLKVRCFALPAYHSGAVNGPEDEFVGGVVNTAKYVFASRPQRPAAAASADAPAHRPVAAPAAERTASQPTQRERRDKRPRTPVHAIAAESQAPSAVVSSVLPAMTPALWTAFLERIENTPELNAAERHAYRRVATFQDPEEAVNAGMAPGDVARVMNDVALFLAVNIDLIKPPPPPST